MDESDCGPLVGVLVELEALGGVVVVVAAVEIPSVRTVEVVPRRQPVAATATGRGQVHRVGGQQAKSRTDRYVRDAEGLVGVAGEGLVLGEVAEVPLAVESPR